MESKKAQDFNVLPRSLKVLVIGALIIGIFFRFYHLDQKIYSNDETFSTTLIFSQSFLNYDSIISVDALQSYQWINLDLSLSESLEKLIAEPYVFPPLYPVAMRLWAGFWNIWFDNPVAIQRSFSAFISIFAFICIYWLCIELFKSHLVAWVAMTLVAISPFHVQYSQIVRPYSLLTVATLLSSASLLRAMQVKTKLSWIIYAFTVAIGLYSNVLFGFVLVAHTTYVLILERLKLNSNLKSYFIASAGGVITFLPWFWLFINSTMLEYSTAQIDSRISYVSLLTAWIKNFKPIFFDFYDPWVNYTQIFRQLNLWLFPLLLTLIFISFYFLFRKAPERIWLFILTLVGMTGIALMAKDMIFGGSSTTRLRYVIPSVLGIELVVAYFVATRFKSNRNLQRKFGGVTLSALILSGVISCAIISQAESWWVYGSPFYPRVARIINQANRPLVITDNLGRAFTLSYLLDSKVRFKLVQGTSNVPDGFSDIFLLELPKDFRQKIEKNQDYKMERLFDKSSNLPIIPEVWRLEKK